MDEITKVKRIIARSKKLVAGLEECHDMLIATASEAAMDAFNEVYAREVATLDYYCDRLEFLEAVKQQEDEKKSKQS